jgi:hypothetical protein
VSFKLLLFYFFGLGATGGVGFCPFSENLKGHFSVTTHPRYPSIHFSLSPHINISLNSFKLVVLFRVCDTSRMLQDKLIIKRLKRFKACHCKNRVTKFK